MSQDTRTGYSGEDVPATAPDCSPASVSAPLNLVAIGASAGGIQALRDFFKQVPSDAGMAFVVVIHLSPEHESGLAEVIRTFTHLRVEHVEARVPLEHDRVYVIPPDRKVSVVDGHLDVAKFEHARERQAPIDLLFRTVADAHPDGTGVLLSGMGTDGVVGLTAIKEKGGVILVQSPAEAEFDAMPSAAVGTGLVDFVLPARELGAKVVALRTTGLPWEPPSDAGDLADGDAELIHEILRQLHVRTGHDFSGYKKSTVLRRIARRMHVCHVQDLASYLRLLRRGETEARALLKDLLISVTTFFRDPKAFEALEKNVLPELLRSRSPHEQIRVWVPGCATGEEAYSIAMLLAEAGEAAKIRRSPQIFATDLDEEAIAFAREGIYPDAIRADVSPERLQRFFHREGDYYRMGKKLREMVLFATHTVIRDPPFSRLDLISCRNLLIYLERETQQSVLGIFAYALREDGFLILGGSEGVDEGRKGFAVFDKKFRIYRRQPGPQELDALPLLHGAPGHPRRRGTAVTRHRAPASGAALHREALEACSPPSIVLDEDRCVLHVSESANRYLVYPAGSPTDDVLKVLRRELRIELRAALHRTLETGQPTLTGRIPLEIDGEPRTVQLHVGVTRPPERVTLALVTFLEGDPTPGGTAAASPEGEAVRPQGKAGRRLEEPEAELEMLRGRMQDLIDESETRQEELLASNEELQSVNEEYKSTLEELETSKEELQSMNEELKTVNDELTGKVEALARAHDKLENLIAATDVATLFLDRRLRVRFYTPTLERIFNIISVDRGRPLDHMTHGLLYDDLTRDCETVLRSLRPLEREVSARSGEEYLVRMTPFRTGNDRIAGVVATFTDVTRLRAARREVEENEERFRALVEATAQIVWRTDPQGLVDSHAPSWRAFTGQTEEEREGLGWLQAVHPDDRARVEVDWERAVGAEEPWESEFRLRHAASGGWRVTEVRALPVRSANGSVREWVAMSTDITERRRMEGEMREAHLGAEAANRAKTQFLSTLSHELRTPLNAIIGLTELLASEVFGSVDQKQREPLERIRRAAWHQQQMVEEILAFARTEAGQEEVRLSAVDAAALVREVTEMFEAHAREKGIELQRTGVESPLRTMTDPRKLRQIVINLMGNALRFTKQGRVAVALESANGALELTVGDTGPGIPPDRLEDIFDPFIQVGEIERGPQGGTGLGLTISRRFARLLGGDVEVDSEVGRGSTFTVRLPAHRRAASGPATD